MSIQIHLMFNFVILSIKYPIKKSQLLNIQDMYSNPKKKPNMWKFIINFSFQFLRHEKFLDVPNVPINFPIEKNWGVAASTLKTHFFITCWRRSGSGGSHEGIATSLSEIPREGPAGNSHIFLFRGTTNPYGLKFIFCRKNTRKFQVVLVCLRILVSGILFSIDSHFNPVHWTTELGLARCFNPMPRNYDATRSCKRANQQDAS